VLSDEVVAALVQSEPDPHVAARRVRDAALLHRSGDNITVVVVRLDRRKDLDAAAA
jgi:serine/threonine protein phosphatase PrpC